MTPATPTKISRNSSDRSANLCWKPKRQRKIPETIATPICQPLLTSFASPPISFSIFSSALSIGIFSRVSSLKLLTEAGYSVYLDESSDCPHLVVELDKQRNLSAILTFGSNSAGIPSIFLREHQNLERIDLDPIQWQESGRNLVAIMAAVRMAAR